MARVRSVYYYVKTVRTQLLLWLQELRHELRRRVHAERARILQKWRELRARVF